jgi:hypothetical protein
MEQVAHMGKSEVSIIFWVERLKEKDHSETLCTDRIILN